MVVRRQTITEDRPCCMFLTVFLFSTRCGDVREVELASLTDPVLRQYTPFVYHTISDPKKVCSILAATQILFL